jgi:hypothetical protein
MNKWIESSNPLCPRLDSNLLTYTFKGKVLYLYYNNHDKKITILKNECLFWKYMENQKEYSSRIILKEMEYAEPPGFDILELCIKSEGVKI